MLSVNESTWDKNLRAHTCCGSTHSYHKYNCATRKQIIPGRTSDPTFVSIQDLKRQGLNSKEVARELNIPISQVNDLWS